MKILVVDFAASSGGALSILKDYYKDVLDDKENNYLFLLNDYYLKQNDNIKIKIMKKYKKWIPRLYFDFIKGRKIVKEFNPDIIFSLQNTIIRGIEKKQIVYMHQAIPFQNQKKYSIFKKSEFKLALIQKLIGIVIKTSLKKADKIIVQTKWIKDSIIEKTNISSNKIVVVPPKINLDDVVRNKSDSSNQFFYPTSNEVYKNNDLINRAVELLNEEGIYNFNVELTLNGISNQNNINYIGKLDRKEVFNKYSKSILLFPSYMESYGLPLLEAKNSNAIIFAADTPFAHEILDDYINAYFFDPFKENELKELMKAAINKNIVIKRNAINNRINYINKNESVSNIIKKECSLKNILWLTNIPSPYRVNFFNELGSKANLNVIFERKTSSERDKSWGNFDIENFNYIFLKGIKYSVDKTISFGIIRYIKKNKDNIIFLSNYSSLTGMIAAFYMIMNNIPYIIETDGGFAKNNNNFKEKIKKFVISNAKKCFSTSCEGDNYYLHYGANKNNIVRYPFTSLYEKDILQKPINKNERIFLRKKYNVKEEKIIVSIGRFDRNKGFDVLLNAFSNIENKSIGLYIIGGEPTIEYKQIIKNKKIKNVHFINFIPKNIIFDYLKLSNLFVLATRMDVWGLVVNEAMACGLPVITTNKCIAGLELIVNNINGYIISVDDYLDLQNKMKKILEDEQLENLMRLNNINKIKNYSFESMADTHLHALKSTIK